MGQFWRASKSQHGYHVLQVSPNGPGDEAGLVSYFDFIVKINDQTLNDQNGLVESVFASSVGKQVKLSVYNSQFETTRDVYLTSSESWGGAGVAGLSIRYCSYDKTSHVWHVLEIQPNSPAAISGLQPFTDYIVGSPDVIFSHSEDFFSLIQLSTSPSIPLYVYSTITNQVRLVSLSPNKHWGGSGCLGCDIGVGVLHQIPTKDPTTPVSTPQKPIDPAIQSPIVNSENATPSLDFGTEFSNLH